MRIIFLLLILLSCLTACAPQQEEISSSSVASTAAAVSSIPEPQSVPEPEPIVQEVTLMAVGDNLYHYNVWDVGRMSDGSYDYRCVYEHIADLVKSFDLAVINQETVFVTDENQISFYPCFGTPTAVGEELIRTGFDVMLGATNHSYDKRQNGVLETVAFWKSHPEITYLGMHDSVEDYETIRIIEKNGIKIAMLNYTYGLNGFVIPEEFYYYVDTLYNEEKVRQDLEYAEANADFTIVFPHWGTEYVYDETAYQQHWADFFTQHGADLIIGAHPHVVEPVKKITTENGNTAICYYSLGNFVSGQDEKPRMLGGIATVTLRKTVDDETVTKEIAETDMIPSVTHFNREEHTIYLLEDYTDELSQNSSMHASPAYLWELWTDIHQDSDCPYRTPAESDSSNESDSLAVSA